MAIASSFENAAKKESQDICFVPDGDYAAFIERTDNFVSEKGEYTDINGKVIHKDTLTNFDDDKSIPTWVDKSVNELSKLGVINGYKEGDKAYFKPANHIKRAEALVMIQRSKTKIEHK